MMDRTAAQPGVYGHFRGRAEHVEDRRAKWDEWRALPASARKQEHATLSAERLHEMGPFRGVTTDGHVQPDLFSVVRTGVSTRRMVEAANDFLRSVGEERRTAACLPIDTPEWRLWINGMELRLRHGLLLEDLTASQRDAALGVLRASLSLDGFERVRTIMYLNRVLGEITGDPGILNEWRYWLSIFGQPGPDQPWGWQLDGHHLNISCFVLGDQVVLTPCFMGAEPRISDREPFPEARAFDREQRTAVELVQALSAPQREQAILYPSMLSKDLPPVRRHPTEGRMQAGAFRDNAVMPYEGIRAVQLTNAQRGLLMDLIGTYVAFLPSGHDDVRRREIMAHLDQTHFAWIGRTDSDQGPFFYKVHSPVLLIEFDHHRGVFLDNSEPEGLHAHSVVRTPNGNDYGRDLLRQHYAQHPHLA
ncbi:MAG: DUF3500 domain-containing protein [Chloroflexi bacterium]|nr:DUF3500 domain-containing protein [Chloroflexota bacterium]